MAEIEHHDLSDLWTVVATFEVDGTPTAPGAVSAVLRKPSGTLETIPALDSRITSPSTGVYEIADVGDEVGVHYLEVTGTSPAAGRERFSFVVDPRWPADLLEPHALTSIEDCELALDRVGQQASTGYEADDKRWLANLINTFSTLVQQYAQREWLPMTDDLEPDVARTFLYDGDGIVSLAPYEARAISAVAMRSNLPPELRGPGDDLTEGYVAFGYSWYGSPLTQTESGTWLELQIPKRRNWSQVTVTGKWGAGVVPPDVKHVVEAEVANSYWASRVRTPAGGALEGSYLPSPTIGATDGKALDPRSERILDGYRNVGLV